MLLWDVLKIFERRHVIRFQCVPCDYALQIHFENRFWTRCQQNWAVLFYGWKHQIVVPRYRWQMLWSHNTVTMKRCHAGTGMDKETTGNKERAKLKLTCCMDVCFVIKQAGMANAFKKTDFPVNMLCHFLKNYFQICSIWQANVSF